MLQKSEQKRKMLHPLNLRSDFGCVAKNLREMPEGVKSSFPVYLRPPPQTG